MAFALEGATSIRIEQGQSASAVYRILATSRPYRQVSLSIGGLPSGVSAQFSPTSGKPSFNSTLTLTASTNATVGIHSLTITARDAKSTKRIVLMADLFRMLNRPPVVVGDTYFFAGAEETAIGDIWPAWGIISSPLNPDPAISTDRFKSGTHCYKHDITDATENSHYSQLDHNSPQTSMGGPSGHFMGGYYSFWLWTTGPVESDWNVLLGWMTGVGGAPSPICNMHLRRWPNAPLGPLQLSMEFKNAQAGCYTAPAISGYQLDSSNYFQTASSPNGITTFPTSQWVHVEVKYTMAATNGRVEIYQDGVLVMDLTHADLNTFHGWSIDPCTNAAGDMIFQFGVYGGAKTTAFTLYSDDFRVTNYRVYPTL